MSLLDSFKKFFSPSAPTTPAERAAVEPERVRAAQPLLQPRARHVLCSGPHGLHRVAYTEWGEPTNRRVLVCVHGLTRNGRDFDDLARALAGEYRVVCPDVVGRGRSDWLKDPMGYQIPTYVGDMLALLAELQQQAPIGNLDWVGTSMGGLIGLLLAGQPDLPRPAPVRRLVLNDVGPVIEWRALLRIGEYIGQVGHFDSVQQAADAMWLVSTTFGPHTPEQWLALSQAMVRPSPNGGFTLHYDPAIAVPLRTVTQQSAQECGVDVGRSVDAACELRLRVVEAGGV